MPLTNGKNRESFIFTYAGPLPVPPASSSSSSSSSSSTSRSRSSSRSRRKSRWPVGSYGGGPTEPSGYARNFLECAREIDALGYCAGNHLHRQLLGLELTHPAAAASAAASEQEAAAGIDGGSRSSSSVSSSSSSISDALVVRAGEPMLQHPQQYLEEIQYEVV
jgi:hypothetical protein